MYGKSLRSGAKNEVVEDNAVIDRVASLSLPASEYEFFAWALAESDGYGTSEVRLARIFSYRFVVKPGQATYVGQFNLDLRAPLSPRLTVEDRQARDLAIVKSTGPAIVDRVEVAVGKLQL